MSNVPLSTGTYSDELSDKGKAAVSKTLDAYGVTHKSMVAEIENTITPSSLSLGAEWYAEANRYARQLSRDYEVEFHRVVAVISALSPRMSWPRNKVIAERTVAAWVFNEARAWPLASDELVKVIGGALSANITLAVRILQGESIDSVLTGVKRRSFYNNIAFPNVDDSVTVDTWMQRVVMRASLNAPGVDLDESIKFLGASRKVTNGAGAGYVAIAEAVREVAANHGVSAHVIQAAYWVVMSGSVHGNHHKRHGLSTSNYSN